MKILVFGQKGQVATELARRLPSKVSADFVGRDRVDLLDPAKCAEVIRRTDADAVINAAAFTAVDRAESNEAEVNIINASAPGSMAQACAERNLPFLHLSSDYVFGGSGNSPLYPNHEVAPLSVYGRSKLNGELLVRSAGARHLILRTSWIFSAHGSNFVRTILRVGRERPVLRVVSDQVGGPTPAAAIADALVSCTKQLIEGSDGGTHHFSGAPDTSWASFARCIIEDAGLQCDVDDILTVDYPTPASRPLNSRLDCNSFYTQFGISRPNWRQGLRDVLVELGEIGCKEKV